MINFSCLMWTELNTFTTLTMESYVPAFSNSAENFVSTSCGEVASDPEPARQMKVTSRSDLFPANPDMKDLEERRVDAKCGHEVKEHPREDEKIASNICGRSRTTTTRR